MKTLVVIPLALFFLVGCSRMNESVLGGRLQAIVGKTTRLVFSISELPDPVRNSFIEALNPFRDIDLDQLDASDRVRFSILKTRDWPIADRGDQWLEGCSSGDHFLAAGEADTGVWWIWFESGGIVSQRKIIVISEIGSTSPYVESFDVPRAFHVYRNAKAPN